MKKYLIAIILMSVLSLNTAYASESFDFEAEVKNEIIYLSFDSEETKPVFNIWIRSCSDNGLQFETGEGTRVDCSGGNGRVGNFEGSGELKLIPQNLEEDTDVTFYVSYSSNTSDDSVYEVGGTSRSVYKSVTINMDDDSDDNDDNDDDSTNTPRTNLSSQEKLDLVAKTFGSNSDIYRLVQLLINLNII